MPRVLLVLTMFGLVGLSGCTSANDSNSSASDSSRLGSSQEKVREGFDELQGLINLTAEPDELLWTEESLDEETAAKSGHKAGTRRLLAVIRFEVSPTPFEGFFNGGGTAASVEVEDWFPAELVAQGQSGGGSVKGTAVDAASFFKAPYSQGRLVKFEGSSFYILELFAE